MNQPLKSLRGLWWWALVWIQRDQTEDKANGLYHFCYNQSLLIYYPISLHNRGTQEADLQQNETENTKWNTHTLTHHGVCNGQRRAGDNQQYSVFQFWYTLLLYLYFPSTCLTVFPPSYPFQFKSLLLSLPLEKQVIHQLNLLVLLRIICVKIMIVIFENNLLFSIQKLIWPIKTQ